MRKSIPLVPFAVNPLGTAQLAGVSRSRIYELLDEGELPSYRDGRRRLIRVADVQAWLARLKPAQSAAGPFLPEEDQELARRLATEPVTDFARLFREKRRSLESEFSPEQATAGAFDYVVSLIRAQPGVTLKRAKAMVRGALKQARSDAAVTDKARETV
jgi:excisionase family DNA binding protein